jgi:hypothetical protein
MATSRWRPSDTEIARFARYVRAAEQPLSILHDLEAGTLTREAVETVKELYPKLYGQIGQSLFMRAAELRETVPYAARVQLSILFGKPVDATTRPDFVAEMQQTFAMLDNQPGGRTGGGGPSGISDRLSTPVDRLMST